MGKSKILIISEENDSTTEIVIRWIRYLGADFLRINDTSILDLDFMSIDEESDDVQFQFNNKKYCLSDFTSYWYRRGRLNFNFPKIEMSGEILQKSVSRMLEMENNYILNHIYNYFEKRVGIKTIGSIYDNNTNKMSNLLSARSVGLKIPASAVVTSKKKASEFIKNKKKIIVKPIYQAGFLYEDSNKISTGFTSLISEQEIFELPKNIYPSLMQEYIEKKYELRIFYLHGLCYSSAIFSQLDPQTVVDFRNYNWQKPNRTPPYNLPKNISTKIKKLMDKIGMNCGSIDMIVTPNNDFVFLEVNPVGQFWQVSYPCNYYLEKKIAEFLCSK
ncbi:MAG: grasp-with-spasm system ATP-grasp peptide maturase [Flavobacteriaceae bacterium]|nr:grasp-with-spasm system ATP-grasp peptide maturase [Flavobacteriaceae bacterium]